MNKTQKGKYEMSSEWNEIIFLQNPEEYNCIQLK